MSPKRALITILTALSIPAGLLAIAFFSGTVFSKFTELLETTFLIQKQELYPEHQIETMLRETDSLYVRGTIPDSAATFRAASSALEYFDPDDVDIWPVAHIGEVHVLQMQWRNRKTGNQCVIVAISPPGMDMEACYGS